MSRADLAAIALKASLVCRRKGAVTLLEPVNPIDLAGSLGVKVRFVDISMEGMYHGGRAPCIIISSLRPLGRRHFTCAHELAHHAFGHGSSIDELQESTHTASFQPNEFLADVFAGHLLLPIPGVRRAFADRGHEICAASPLAIAQVSSNFGVGFDTLISHLSATGNLPDNQSKALRKVGVAGARREVLGFDTSQSLLLIDEHFDAKTADLEVGNMIAFPPDVTVTGSNLRIIDLTKRHLLCEAVRPGICRAISEQRHWSAFIRISRNAYVGLAAYRHLEDEDE